MMAASTLHTSSSDYLSNPALVAYFAAREHEAYYRSLKSADERRAFHDQLNGALLEFLRLCDEAVLPVLDAIIAKAAQVAHLRSTGSDDATTYSWARSMRDAGSTGC